MMAVVPLFAVLGGTVMLEIAVPVINALAVEPGKIAPQAAMAFFLVGAVHVALMLMMLKVGATMVGGWTVFGMLGSGARNAGDGASAAAPSPAITTVEQAAAPAAAKTSAAPRRLAIAGVAAGMPANDATASGSVAVTNQNRTYATGGRQPGALSSSTARARGVGSRFRSPNTAKLARSTEGLS